MDDEIRKAGVAVGAKLVEAAAPAALQKLLHSLPFGNFGKPLEKKGFGPDPGQVDRRHSNLDRRLRKGFWFAYHRKTEGGKFDILELTQGARDTLSDALLSECQHYEFSDRNSALPLARYTVVEAALDAVWRQFEAGPAESRQAVMVIEWAAKYVFSTYTVRRTMK